MGGIELHGFFVTDNEMIAFSTDYQFARAQKEKRKKEIAQEGRQIVTGDLLNIPSLVIHTLQLHHEERVFQEPSLGGPRPLLRRLQPMNESWGTSWPHTIELIAKLQGELGAAFPHVLLTVILDVSRRSGHQLFEEKKGATQSLEPKSQAEVSATVGEILVLAELLGEYGINLILYVSDTDGLIPTQLKQHHHIRIASGQNALVQSLDSLVEEKKKKATSV